MKIECFRFNLFDENTYLVYDDTKECVIIDPGCYLQEERDFFVATISSKGLLPKYIVNTHCHCDHIFGVNYIKNYYKIPFAANNVDEFLLKNVAAYSSVFGIDFSDEIVIDIDCKDGTEFQFGNSVLKCASTPGHSPGSQIIYSDSDKFMFSGDTIFKDTIGRTDLAGGDYDQLMASIRNVVLRFDSLYDIFPGHGDKTSVGVEAGQNPFIEVSQSET